MHPVQACPSLTSEDDSMDLAASYARIRATSQKICEPLEVEGERLEVSDLLGVPIVEATVRGHARRLFFDTGAKLSYANDEIVAGLASTGRERDFYPGFGTFETDVYDVPVVLGGIEATVPCGVLPPLLRLVLLMGGAHGILGTAIFDHADVAFALPDGKIVVR